jgi:dihydrofolate reductase
MRYWTAQMERADALLFGRVTYEMMAAAWRKPAAGTWPDWMDEWQEPFAETINRAKKYVVSSTLSGVDWNAELVRGDLALAIRQLKQVPGEGLWVGGVTLPLALADLGLIDEYEFLVQPVLAGHGPTLLAGLRERIQLELVDRHEFRSGQSPCGTDPRELRLDKHVLARWPSLTGRFSPSDPTPILMIMSTNRSFASDANTTPSPQIANKIRQLRRHIHRVRQSPSLIGKEENSDFRSTSFTPRVFVLLLPLRLCRR